MIDLNILTIAVTLLATASAAVAGWVTQNFRSELLGVLPALLTLVALQQIVPL